ncbi:GNAT family N-acetyltransferase [Streptomyces sp. SP18CS02]|uniref:GNAT family N-acetyltransferase n=1 Tax=Streptomyces sp. SP18CS02 TaxID=3002531 RepID=UPI002E773A63|nr:GNAT family N-acetyltransferase [Streptomyces sp. SP18CS02]MEE1751104.1 GNAT family N-acetyltransferase [Streptomyces sp. SP18CS02]
MTPARPAGQVADGQAGPVAAAGREGGGSDGFDVAVCRDAERFGLLGPAWAELHRRCRTATPFQSHSWLHSWWLSYGTPGCLRVVLVRRDGQLVAAAPLRLVRGPVPVLTGLGGTITDYSDVLVDDVAAGAADALTGALGRLARTAVIDLREVRPGAAAERVHAGWRGPRARLADSTCLELPALSIDRLVDRLPSSRAQRARSKLRKLDREGIEEHVVPPAEVPEALRRLLDLHQRQWQGRGVTAEHVSVRFAEHLERAVRPMVESGEAMVTEFRLAGDLVAADLTLLSPRLSGGYLYGADPVLRARKVDVATMLLRNGARRSSASGRATLSLLRGDEPYKHHWRPETVGNQRLLMARPELAPALWLRVAHARARGWAADRVRGRAWARRLRRGGGG